MPVHMIGYDLNRENANYAAKSKLLIEKIKEMFPTWWHRLDSTWLVETNLLTWQVRGLLVPLLDANDELLVAELSGRAAWHGFNELGEKWLRARWPS